MRTWEEEREDLIREGRWEGLREDGCGLRERESCEDGLPCPSALKMRRDQIQGTRTRVS